MHVLWHIYFWNETPYFQLSAIVVSQDGGKIIQKLGV
jgi:hypothetical protein